MSSVIQSIFYNNPDQYPPIVNSTRLLARAGYRISILCRENGQSWQVTYPPEAQVARLDTRGGGSWREYLLFVRQVLLRSDPRAQVFIGHDAHGLLPARLLAWRYRRPLIYHCHDYFDPRGPLALGGRLVRAFEFRWARTAQWVIVPDQERGAVVARDLHLRQPPVIVANAPLNRPCGDGTVLQKTLVDRDRRFTQILFRQGRVGVGHGLDMTIRSIPYWGNRQWGFVVMGPGDTAYIEHLTELADACGVKEQFVYLPPVGYDQVAALTPGAQAGHALYDPIHINNVHITTASNKIMEYLAAGLPLIVSDRPALRALVETYRCGVCADERSPESIAAAVNALLGDPAQARRWGWNGRRAFEEIFCYERQFAPVLEALKRLNG